MTSNIGTRDIKLDKVFGFGESTVKTNYDKIKGTIEESVKRVFSPEFLNRVDEMIIFRQLEKEDIVRIVDIGIGRLLSRIQLQGVKIEVAKSALEFLAEKGYDQNYGARPLRRAIQKFLEDPLSEEILKGNLKDGDKIKVKHKKGSDELTFNDDKNDKAEKTEDKAADKSEKTEKKDSAGNDIIAETIEESKDNKE